MTSAGSATVAVAVEDTLTNLPGTPTWFLPGMDLEVGTASLDRALNRERKPNDPRPAGSREGNREGALSLTFVMTDTNFHDLVFPDAGAGLADEASLAPSATVYLQAGLPDGTDQERFLQGATVTDVQWQYQQGQDTTVQLTLAYADEIGGSNASAPATPATISEPSIDDKVTFASTDFSIDATTIEKLQSATVAISNMARFRRGQQQTPLDAVVGAYQPSATVQAIISDGTQRELAYGSAGASDTEDEVGVRDGTLTVDNPSGNVATYTLKNLQPTNYDWADLVNADTDVTDPTEYHLTDVQP